MQGICDFDEVCDVGEVEAWMRVCDFVEAEEDVAEGCSWGEVGGEAFDDYGGGEDAGGGDGVGFLLHAHLEGGEVDGFEGGDDADVRF